MKITIKQTTKIVHLNKVPCRIWEGTTEGGVKINAYIRLISIVADEAIPKDFTAELNVYDEPSEKNVHHPDFFYFQL